MAFEIVNGGNAGIRPVVSSIDDSCYRVDLSQ